MNKFAFQYAILRYMHDPLTEEFINVGVVIYSKEARFLKLEANSRYSRLSRTFTNINGVHYRRIVRHLQRQIAAFHQKYHSQYDLLDEMPSKLDVILNSVLTPDDSSLIFGGHGGGLTFDLNKELKRLFERFVLKYEKQKTGESRNQLKTEFHNLGARNSNNSNYKKAIELLKRRYKMFNSKKQRLFEKVEKRTSENLFVKTGLRKQSITTSGNGSMKYDKVDNDFVVQFNNLGIYRNPRDFASIKRDQNLLWGQDRSLSIRFILFLRAITRKTMLPNGDVMDTVTKGGGLKHESIMRMLWLHNQDKKSFFNNLPLFISVGSWKDIFDMLRYDLEYHGWEGRILDWNKMFEVIAAGLTNENHVNMIKKYLPQIVARSKCTTVRSQANTIIGKWIMSRLKLNYKQYRLLKSSGTAHQWQQLISKQMFHKIDFNRVHGRALAKLVGGNFLRNQGLEDKYQKWIEKQPVAKFTGFPHELFPKGTVPVKQYQRMTVDKQFMGLVEAAKGNNKFDSGLIVVRDTSGSMGSTAIGANESSYNVAKAVALFFSYFLKGHFADSWIEFNRTALLHKWKGSTPTSRWENDYSRIVGNTNFLGVAELFISVKRTGVPENQFPKGIVCISDGEFDRAGHKVTNFRKFKQMLEGAAFSKEYVDNFKIVLWDIPNEFYRHGAKAAPKFETHSAQVPNVFYLSGYSPAILSFLFGNEVKGKVTPEPKNAEELVLAALNQEIMNYLV